MRLAGTLKKNTSMDDLTAKTIWNGVEGSEFILGYPTKSTRPCVSMLAPGGSERVGEAVTLSPK